jgi:hypothetical protein
MATLLDPMTPSIPDNDRDRHFASAAVTLSALRLHLGGRRFRPLPTVRYGLPVAVRAKLTSWPSCTTYSATAGGSGIFNVICDVTEGVPGCGDRYLARARPVRCKWALRTAAIAWAAAGS